MSFGKAYIQDERGAAAAEIAMFAIFIVPIMLNLIDLGAYAFQRTQVESAAQAGAQAAWRYCPNPPAASCGSTLTTVVTAAIQNTALGNAVTLDNVLTDDAHYYCPTASNSLNSVGNSATVCTGTTNQSSGYFIKVTARYSYKPIFRVGTVASLLPTSIVSTAWTRAS